MTTMEIIKLQHIHQIPGHIPFFRWAAANHDIVENEKTCYGCNGTGEDVGRDDNTCQVCNGFGMAPSARKEYVTRCKQDEIIGRLPNNGFAADMNPPRNFS